MSVSVNHQSFFIQGFTTTPDEKMAREIARALVGRKLAACVQVSGPIASFYSWKNNLEEDREWLCIIKSTTECIDDIEQVILELHSYEVPEFIVTQIISGSEDYLSWLENQLDT